MSINTTTRNVRSVLKDLGLLNYEKQFQENAIHTIDDLLYLSADDLKELGLKKIGDRNRLQKWIQQGTQEKSTAFSSISHTFQGSILEESEYDFDFRCESDDLRSTRSTYDEEDQDSRKTTTTGRDSIPKEVEVDTSSLQAICNAISNIQMHSSISHNKIPEGCGTLLNLAIQDHMARTSIVENGGVTAIVSAMLGNRDNVEVQLKAFLLIFLLVEDTGMEFWDLENLNISDLAVDASLQNAFGGLAVHAIIGAMEYHRDMPDICGPACTSLACLSFGNAPNQEFVTHANGIKLILGAMQRFKKVLEVQECAFVALLSLAENIQTKVSIADEGGIYVILAAMQEFEASESIQVKACVLLRTLASNCRKIKESHDILKAISKIIFAMERHKDVAIVQEEACYSLWVLAFNNLRTKEKIVLSDGTNRVQEAMRYHGWDPSVRYVAQKALDTLMEPVHDYPLTTECNPEDTSNHYRKIFDEIDVNSNGLIEFDELRRAFKVLGMLEDQLSTINIFLEADQDCSGNIDFDEFQQILQNNPMHCLHNIVTNPKKALCRLKNAFRNSELEFLQKNITELTDDAIDEILFYTSDHVIAVVPDICDCEVDWCGVAFNKLVWQKDHIRFFAEFICNMKESNANTDPDDNVNMKEVIDNITHRFLVIIHRYCHYNALFGDPIKSKEGARKFRFSAMLAACYSEFFEDAECSSNKENGSQHGNCTHDGSIGLIGSLLGLFE